MPISLLRCTTDTTRTLAIPMANDSATKLRISVFELFWAATAEKNWALVLIQLSACAPVAAAIRCATV